MASMSEKVGDGNRRNKETEKEAAPEESMDPAEEAEETVGEEEDVEPKKPRRRSIALTTEQRLGKEAEKNLRRVSGDLAKSLGQKAAKGDVASAKLLLQLAEKGKEAAGCRDRAEDQAAAAALIEQWTNEPEWTGKKFGEEYLPLCDEKGMHDAKKAGIYGSTLLRSQAIDAIDHAG